jgi:hypothetical protein
LERQHDGKLDGQLGPSDRADAIGLRPCGALSSKAILEFARGARPPLLWRWRSKSLRGLSRRCPACPVRLCPEIGCLGVASEACRRGLRYAAIARAKMTCFSNIFVSPDGQSDDGVAVCQSWAKRGAWPKARLGTFATASVQNCFWMTVTERIVSSSLDEHAYGRQRQMQCAACSRTINDSVLDEKGSSLKPPGKALAANLWLLSMCAVTPLQLNWRLRRFVVVLLFPC